MNALSVIAAYLVAAVCWLGLQLLLAFGILVLCGMFCITCIGSMWEHAKNRWVAWRRN